MLGHLSHTRWPWDAPTSVRQGAYPLPEGPLRSHGACRGLPSGTEGPIQGLQDGLRGGRFTSDVPRLSRNLVGVMPADLR